MIKPDIGKSSCFTCLTNDCFIKQYCSEEYISLINKFKETSVYREDQYIAYEGNSVLGLFFILNGKVKVISSGLDDKIQVVRLTKSGDIIGHRGFGGDKYPISAVALEECTICFIDNETDRKSTRLNSSHTDISRMPSSA